MKKAPSDSITETSFIATPADTNSIGSVFGGRIMQHLDMTAAICARRHSNARVTTVAVNKLKFLKPLRVGHVVKITAKMTRAFKTSMEVQTKVYGEDTYADETFLAATAFFTIVGMDEKNNPIPIPDLMPQSEEELNAWKEAGGRRKGKNE
ncbi:MAG: acyl-CoA thioesterase [Calditrichaeota bacterium]|nr:acyl-CoA thioesterase [Calditrichota bacterium]